MFCSLLFWMQNWQSCRHHYQATVAIAHMQLTFICNSRALGPRPEAEAGDGRWRWRQRVASTNIIALCGFSCNATQRSMPPTQRVSCNMEMTQTLLFLNGILEQSRCVFPPAAVTLPKLTSAVSPIPGYLCLPAALCMHETESSAITRTYYVYSCDTKCHLVRAIYEPTNVEQVHYGEFFCLSAYEKDIRESMSSLYYNIIQVIEI